MLNLIVEWIGFFYGLVRVILILNISMGFVIYNWYIFIEGIFVLKVVVVVWLENIL